MIDDLTETVWRELVNHADQRTTTPSLAISDIAQTTGGSPSEVEMAITAMIAAGIDHI